MEKFETTFELWLEVNKTLYCECVEYISKVLDEMPDNVIVINEDCPCCCSYDGGNHPEYASNCYSTVTEVYKKDDEIYLCIEDDTQYSISRINADEIVDIAFSVKKSIRLNAE